MLVYPPQTDSLAELRWRDRTGKQLGTLGAPGEYYTPRISPDGRRVAFSRRDGDNSDIWVASLPGTSFTRLTFDPAIDENPVWSPDGAAVTFANYASGNANVYRKAATGAGTIDRLTTNTFEQEPLDWSRDGRFLLYTQVTRSTEIMVQAAGGGPPLSFLGHARGAAKPSSTQVCRVGSHTISTTAVGARSTCRPSSLASPRRPRAGRFPMPAG